MHTVGKNCYLNTMFVIPVAYMSNSSYVWYAFQIINHSLVLVPNNLITLFWYVHSYTRYGS